MVAVTVDKIRKLRLQLRNHTYPVTASQLLRSHDRISQPS